MQQTLEDVMNERTIRDNPSPFEEEEIEEVEDYEEYDNKNDYEFYMGD